MHPHAHSQFSPWQAPLDISPATGQRHVNDTSLSIEDMAFHQKRSAESDIRELISQCRDRYCFAHELLKPHAILPDRLFDREMLDLGLFYLPWSGFCTAYRKSLFDPQMCLLEDQREREIRRWQVFVERECFARFTKDPDWVRAVLETANLIPLRGPHRDTFVGDLFDDIIQDVKERNEYDHDDQD
jgi:hypothetical protein